MACLQCKNCFACATYLIDDDNPSKPIDPKDIRDICRAMGGFQRKNLTN